MLRWAVTMGAIAITMQFSFEPSGSASGAEPSKALAFRMATLDGKDVDLSSYKGKVVMIVNVASECGLTPQYEQLQALHTKYGDKGLAILAFPCNQFGKQEPGTSDEIRDFCSKNYGVEFDIFSKIDVNGDSACDLYKYLTALETEPKGSGDISWNFEKFLLDRDGNVVARFEPRTRPDDPKILSVLTEALTDK